MDFFRDWLKKREQSPPCNSQFSLMNRVGHDWSDLAAAAAAKKRKWSSQVTVLVTQSCLTLYDTLWLFVTLWTIACQDPLSMEFSRQEYWSGLPFSSPGIFATLDQTHVSYVGRQILYHWDTWEAQGFRIWKQRKKRSQENLVLWKEENLSALHCSVIVDFQVSRFPGSLLCFFKQIATTTLQRRWLSSTIMISSHWFQ